MVHCQARVTIFLGRPLCLGIATSWKCLLLYKKADMNEQLPYLFPLLCARPCIMSPLPFARNRPPFRAEHVGSLYRPAALYQARKDNCKCSSKLKFIENESIIKVVKMQKDLGIKTLTDGELRRYFPRFTVPIMTKGAPTEPTFLMVFSTSWMAWNLCRTVSFFAQSCWPMR